MTIKNSSGLIIPFITSATAPTISEETSGAYLGYLWYETDTKQLKAFDDNATGTPQIREL